MNISDETLVKIGMLTSSLGLVIVAVIVAFIVSLIVTTVYFAVENEIKKRELNEKILNRYKITRNTLLIDAYKMNDLEMKKVMFKNYY